MISLAVGDAGNEEVARPMIREGSEYRSWGLTGLSVPAPGRVVERDQTRKQKTYGGWGSTTLGSLRRQIISSLIGAIIDFYSLDPLRCGPVFLRGDSWQLLSRLVSYTARLTIKCPGLIRSGKGKAYITLTNPRDVWLKR